jgi:glycerophosphoryl diester phosphodiesterase
MLAHRGDHRAAPENSLAAVRAAIALPGCDGVEFDLRAAADGTPVLIHDDTLERTHGRRDRVADVTAADLDRAGVPTFGAVLAAVPTDRFLDVEMKEDVVREAAALLTPWIERGGRAIVSSFSDDVLESARRHAPSISRWLNSEVLDSSTIARALSLGCSAVSAAFPEIDGERVSLARRAGLSVAAWTLTDPEELARVAGLGVVAVCAEGRALER